MDESGFPLDGKMGQMKVVLAPKGLKNVYQMQHSSQEQITVVGCTNALGEFMKPYILYPQQRLRDVNYTKFQDAIYSGSETGWMTREHFTDWITHFNTFLTKQKIQHPVILFFDGHTSHVGEDSAVFCHVNYIILYCLLANTNHLIQPLGVGFFSPLKDVFTNSVLEWQRNHLDEALTKTEFHKGLGMAWLKVATIKVAIKAFKISGMFPFYVNAVDFSRIVKHKGNGDGDGEGDKDVQEEAAVNVLGNVINEMGDRLEVTIEVEIETTGTNAKNETQEDEIQTRTQPEGTQQENMESTEQHAVQHSEWEQAEIMHEPEAESVQ